MRSAQYSLPDSYHSGYVKVQTQTNQSDIAIRTHVLANLANIDVSNDTLCAQLSIGDVGMKLTGKSMNRLGGAPPKGTLRLRPVIGRLAFSGMERQTINSDPGPPVGAQAGRKNPSSWV